MEHGLQYLFPEYRLNQSVKVVEQRNKVFLNDLGLNQIFDTLIKTKEKFEISRFYYESLQDKNTIYYRQDIMKELEQNLELRTIMVDFSNKVYSIRKSMNVI